VYGWRSRIGLILPVDNAVMEPELYSQHLPGVSFYSMRLDTMERSQMPLRGVAMSQTFVELGADLIVYACAETSFLQGVDGNTWIQRELESRGGLPAITASGAMIQALSILGASRVSLVTPYTEERTEVMKNFLTRHDMTVSGCVSRDFQEGSGETREWYNTNLQGPSVAYQMARSAVDPSAEAVVIVATNFRTFEIISALEGDLKIPVVTTNQAILWASLRRLGLMDSPAHLGRLFTDH
jgi:maleate isomerase